MSPYSKQSPESYWKTGVAQQHPLTIEGLYKKRFSISASSQIATAGSCFAQHISRHLKSRGYSVLDVEPPPRGLSDARARHFGYLTYSARYGNIYHARQLLQLVKAATGSFVPADVIWQKGDVFVDALRPTVEPIGFATGDEVVAHRQKHLTHVLSMIEKADVFIFTLGLTEAWIHGETGTVYPTAPGVIAGRFDDTKHRFKNFSYHEILHDLLEFRDLTRSINPKMKYILTVSPVPLTATATDKHVLIANTYSKSVLRAVAGALYERFGDVDYFPSYEIIASHFSRGFFFDQNLRTISSSGVAAAMRVFFEAHGDHNISTAQNGSAYALVDEDPACEEVLLEAFLNE